MTTFLNVEALLVLVVISWMVLFQSPLYFFRFAMMKGENGEPYVKCYVDFIYSGSAWK